MSSILQETLVPPILYAGARLEAFGQSTPMEDVGGDLADLVSDGRTVTAYVADVSGHGLRAGVLMGMIKTAVRYGLLLGRPLVKLIEDLNRVLPPLKEPHMFATLAALRFDGSNSAEYLSAGHVPLLHYRSRLGRTVRHAMPQFPLGLFAGATYQSRRIHFESGDIFALVTDGVVESGEEPDADSGLDRVAHTVRQFPARPLAEIVKAIHRELGSGLQEDDRTVLLVRASGPTREEEMLRLTWLPRLDGLAELLARHPV